MDTINQNEQLNAFRDSHDLGSIIGLLETQFQFWLKHSGEQPLDSIRQMSMLYTAIGALVRQGYQPNGNFPLALKERVNDLTIRGQLTSILLELIKPTLAYCVTHPPFNGDEADSYAHLILVIPDARGASLKELQPLAELVRLGDEKLTCTVLQFSYLNQLTRQGHLFYSKYARQQYLIFEDGLSAKPVIDADAFSTGILSAKAHFETGLVKAKHFLQCAEQLAATNLRSYITNGLSLYMLHQATELCYRGALLGLFGIDIRNHSIKTLKKHIQVVSPLMAECLPVNDDTEQVAVALLEDAYISARYKTDFQVTDEQLALATSMVEALLGVAEETFSQHYGDISLSTDVVNHGLALHSFYNG